MYKAIRSVSIKAFTVEMVFISLEWRSREANSRTFHIASASENQAQLPGPNLLTTIINYPCDEKLLHFYSSLFVSSHVTLLAFLSLSLVCSLTAEEEAKARIIAFT
jgi:hypothetical protein